MSRRLYIILVIALLLVGGALAACTPTLFKLQPDKVTIKFNWLHTVEWAGFYVAQEKGYYADENLQVAFVTATEDPLDAVVSGEVDFCTGTGTGLVVTRGAGKPLVAVSAVLRKSPLGVMTRADSGITTPQGLVGKTVSVISPKLDTGWDIQLLAMLNKVGVDRNKVNFKPVTEFGIGPLIRGEVDGIDNAWTTNEGVAAQLEGEQVNFIFPSDYDVLEYPDPIITSEKMIQERPAVVERFVRATLRGYRYAIEHPEEAAQFALKYDDTLDIKLQTASMHTYVPLVDTGDAPIGWMDAEVWQSTQDYMLEQGMVSSSLDLQKLYTNQFVDKATK